MALPYKTGTTVVFSLVSTANSTTPFLVKIVGAAYGNDTTDVTIAPDGLSVSINVVTGSDNLVITVMSPYQTDEALLTQGTIPPPFKFVITNYWDGCRLVIVGTP